MYNNYMSEIVTLSTGLRLAYENMPHLRSVSVGVFVKIGSKHEQKSNYGIAHFTEHMMFKGTKKRSAQQIARDMDALGANSNAYTSKELTCYYIHCLDDNVDECVEVLSDIMLNSVFPDAEIERERNVILEEIAMDQDSPDDLSQTLCAAAYWGEDTPFGHEILGSEKNVKTFTRDDILAFVQKYYTCENIVISIAGNISREHAIEIVEKNFNFPQCKNCQITLPEIAIHGGKLEEYKPINQCNLTYAFPSLCLGSNQEMALLVSDLALGGGLSSILFQKIREEMGLAYSIYTFSSCYVEAGASCIYFATSANNLEKAITAVGKTISSYARAGITKDDLLCAKQQIRSAFILAQDSSSSLMKKVGNRALLLGQEYSLDDTLKNLDAVSIDSIKSMLPLIYGKRPIGLGYVGKETKLDLLRYFD